MAFLDIDLVHAMQTALINGEFVLHYQPQVDLATGEVQAMEALLRWQHPQRGLLEPREFLPSAVGSELIVAIGHWVLDECGHELATWNHTMPPGLADGKQIWANVAAIELTQPDFLAAVTAMVDDYELPEGVLGLEISEGDLLAHSDEAIDTLRGLKDIGVALAVDDFGTWYASMSSLKRVPLDMVKLGHAFVRGVGHDVEEDRVVSSVIDLAHARGLVVVAEGVETWAEGARLCDLGCDRAHGYLFAGPQRPDRARWMLARGVGWEAAGGTLALPPDIVPGQRQTMTDMNAESQPEA
jgi:EAL domain-containing protein (putative c-di-GMP-specific phosphodiesterase class I)